MLTLLTLFACKTSGSIPLDATDTSVTGDDTGSPPDDTEVEDPPAEPDFSVWIGERTIQSRDCEDTLTESGELLDESFQYYDWMQEQCPRCDYFYWVRVSPAQVCDGIPVSQEVLRGLDLSEGEAEVWAFSNQGAYPFDERGSFDGWRVEYDYGLTIENRDYQIEGWVEFPEL